MDVRGIAGQLAEEHDALDAVVAGLTSDQWKAPTASPRWTVAHQIAHLAYFDRTAAVAIADPDHFVPMFEELWAAAAGGDDGVDRFTLGWAVALPPAELLGEWRARRAELLEAARGLDDDARVPWYGPSMGGRSFLTARLMETWAHGQDVVDAVGAERPATDRLEHVARLGVITRGWTYANRGEEMPPATIRVELAAPSGRTLTWGPDDADETVRGSLEDFCLVVTQRRHPDDTALVATGPAARDWLEKSQAFAGPPTDGPEPGNPVQPGK
jgi:uncharacterized protein (TIGR03084 family)